LFSNFSAIFEDLYFRFIFVYVVAGGGKGERRAPAPLPFEALTGRRRSVETSERFELLQQLCRQHACELLVLHTEKVSAEGLDGHQALFLVPVAWLRPRAPSLERGVPVILAHRIALDPTEKQKEYFRQACGTARFVWNWALAEWNYRCGLGANTDAWEIKRYFNSFKYEAFPWLKNIHRDAHAQYAEISFTSSRPGSAKTTRKSLSRT
jgi:hypothetical protein